MNHEETTKSSIDNVIKTLKTYQGVLFYLAAVFITIFIGGNAGVGTYYLSNGGHSQSLFDATTLSSLIGAIIYFESHLVYKYVFAEDGDTE